MATTFDAVAIALGTRRHSLKMHGTLPSGVEPDVGTIGGLPTNSVGGTVSTQLTGPLQDGTTSYAFQFNDGRVTRAQMGNSGDWGSSTVGSISFWFKSSSATNQVMWGTHPSNEGFIFWLLAAGTLQFQVIHGSDATTITTSGTNYADGNWHFVCLVCNGSTDNTLYIDNVAFNPTPSLAGAGLTGHPWIGSINTGAGQLFFGNDERWATTHNFPFIGLMSRWDEWGAALSSDNVNALYLAAFGATVLPSGTPRTYLDLDLPFTNTSFMAQRLFWRKLNDGQRRKSIQIPANLRALQYSAGDVLTVSIADFLIAAQTYRITNWKTAENGIEITLKEDDALAYTDPLIAKYVSPSSLTTPTAALLQVPAPTGLAAAPALDGIDLSWTAPANTIPVIYYNIYGGSTNAWGSATLLGYSLGVSWKHALSTTGTWFYWVRAVNADGNESTRSPNSDTSTVTATFTAGTTSVPSAPQSTGGITTSANLTATFSRAGVVISSCVYTATRSGANLTLSNGSTTGEAQTFTSVGGGTPAITVTVRHTGSQQTTTLTFTVA